ncbi:probable ATP-dependent RNA helicase ddx20 isoform X2 [Myzus persicae]|uniref:probable ATP-dependent RNA helicase ddx20 isoform X2 n=1 Tax=Myzus persicae TaxID=13164 RepID=UPI000B93015F|nr:probable ATP-dependent RNA helicase ddx20 isoform X2 [Myzus persicae]
MNSKISMFMLLAYFLVNLSTESNGKGLDWGNIQSARYKKTLVSNQPIKVHPNVFGNYKVNPVVPYKVTASPAPPPSPAKTSVPPAPLTTPLAANFQSKTKNENENYQGFGIVEDGGDDYEEEEEEEHLENSKTVTSQPMLSSLTSKPIIPKSLNQENDNHQGFDIVEEEGDDYEDEEEEEKEKEEEHLENSKAMTSQPMLSSSTSGPIVPENVNQENDNHQEFKAVEGGDDEEVPEENEYGHKVEEYSEDPNHNTPIDYITINGVRVPMNNFISTVPQLSGDELTENKYNASEYPLNTNEDHQASYYYDDLEPESSNYNDNPTEISETPNRNNDNTKDQSINTNELNSYDNTQISTNKQEDTKEDQFKNQYVTENKERIINGYKAMKKILYMLHDYASSTFNWIINKIDYRMEQVSS